jgi:hypothetical protein
MESHMLNLAYIDPGTGSLLLQALLAGLLSIPFFFRRTIGEFLSRVRGRDASRNSDDTEGGGS